MLTSFLKISSILLLILLLPTICIAENKGAPAKFYDGLQKKSAKTLRHPIVKQKDVASQQFKPFNYKKTTDHKNTVKADLDEVELLEQELEQATAIADRKKLFPKKSLRRSIPTANTENSEVAKNYLVGKNEFLSTIAARLKVSPKQLATWNNITSPDQVYAGQKLKIFKNKQKHSVLKTPKKRPKTVKIVRDNSQKTSIISINNKSMLKFYRQLPTEGKISKNFSQTGGRGIEISGRLGQAIKAIATGKVVAVSPGIYGHGSFIVIEHQNQILSSYANNRNSLVKNGQTVITGQVIAEMGQVGHKPPSLEFEIRKNGKLVDPMRFLPKKI